MPHLAPIQIAVDLSPIVNEIKKLAKEIKAMSVSIQQLVSAYQEIQSAFEEMKAEGAARITELEEQLAAAREGASEEILSQMQSTAAQMRTLFDKPTPESPVVEEAASAGEEVVEPTAEEPVAEAPASPEQPPDTVEPDVENTPL